MERQIWEIQKYLTEKGVCPFEEWFETLDSTTQARIDVRLDLLYFGNFGDHKSVGGGFYELRFLFGIGYRIYYRVTGKQIVVLFTGGNKNSQDKDIRLAERLWTSYQQETKGV